jgi:glutathione-specific gamma-glutamylcyclotransferase
VSTLTRTLLERDTVREELRSSSISAHLLTDEELETSRRAALKSYPKKKSLWIFGYGSLVWNPQLSFQRAERTQIFGYRRALCLWSRINRGTPELPGLVFGLLPGGSCAGIAYEIPASKIESETLLLWRREMLMGSYVPLWASGRNPAGEVMTVLTFRVNPAGVGFAGDLDDARIIEVLRKAQGRFGTCSDYVCNTHSALKEYGISDKRLSRLCKTLAQPDCKTV